MNFNEIKELEQRYYANVFSRLPVAITHGKGMYLYDVDNKEYLDMFAGVAVSSVGHAHPKVVEAIESQAKKLIHTSNWVYTTPQLELAEMLCELTDMSRVFFTNDGTEAVECALKLSHRMTKKNKFVAFKGAFHGRTLGSLGLTYGEKVRSGFNEILNKNYFVDYNDADALERLIKDKQDIAAVIIEPVQGESGVIVPDDGYLAEVRRITEDNGVLLIVDEIQTGFGRTGKLFSCEHEGVKPDIICLAKGMGGGFPIGATLFRDGLDFEKGEHGGTYLGSPLACSVSKAVIEIIQDEKLVENSRLTGKYLLDNLLDSGFNARGRGLMIGIDVSSVSSGKEVVLDLIKEGILSIYSGDVVRVLPPLIITKHQADLFSEKINILKS
ncbi:MAG: hypothetical protein A7316_04600 [Candidatus Altiarchaeales archaeon WOR_SM1_86-2]|nr:MAG: hypothetical protein A7316_04600 [Candidatus Altiarchaeales archaeon WOR_SM1_86-2]